MSEPQYEKLIKNEDFINAVALEIAKVPKLQLLILESVIKNVATKEDIRELRLSTKEEIRELRHYVDVRIGDLDKRIDSLDKRMSLLQWVLAIGFSVLSIILTFLTYVIASLPK